MGRFEVVAASASRSPKEDGGDDRVRSFLSAGPTPGAGIVLCDGVGSVQGSAAVAEAACDLAAAHMESHGVGHGIWQLGGALAGETLERVEGATTLIAAAADEAGLVGHFLIGNGSLIEIEPAEPWPDQVSLRWTDIVLPQIQWEGGRPALRAYLPAPDGELESAKGCRAVAGGRARMYLACSDGIATDEDRAISPARDGRVWKEVPLPLAALLDRLRRGWKSLFDGEPRQADRALASLLEEALAELVDGPGLDDDASVGAVLLRPVQVAGGGHDE